MGHITSHLCFSQCCGNRGDNMRPVTDSIWFWMAFFLFNCLYAITGFRHADYPLMFEAILFASVGG